jgi:hypothetical protein
MKRLYMLLFTLAVGSFGCSALGPDKGSWEAAKADARGDNMKMMYGSPSGGSSQDSRSTYFK